MTTTQRGTGPGTGPVPPQAAVATAAGITASVTGTAGTADGAGGVGGLDGVIARMRALEETLPPHDGVAVFNGVCLTVTTAVRRHLAEALLPRPWATAGLVTVFAHRYLAAVDLAAAGVRLPVCWRPLFRARHHPGVRPVQFALAGINAHVGHDLALAVVGTARAYGCEPAALRGAFDRIGDLLVESEERVHEELTPGPEPLDVADPLTHLVASWSMERARDAAWSAACLLWGMRHLPGMAAEFARRLDAEVGLVGRCLLTPLERLPGPRRA